MKKEFQQKIECTVTSCAHNSKGCDCALDIISVKPCKECHSGKADDESMCNSYRCK